jgi:methyl-accepting chemotaxis protein
MLSSRSKIRISMVSVVIISLGTSILSMYYMNRMVNRIKAIISKDAKIAELGEDLSFGTLTAKRDERNFIIYLDSSYIASAQVVLNEMRANVEKAQSFTDGYKTELDSIHIVIGLYQQDIQILIKTVQEDPQTLNRLQKQVIDYQEELKKLAKSKKMSLEELPAWTSDVSLSLLAASTRISADKARLFEELKGHTDLILKLSEQMTAKARKSFAENSTKSMEYGNIAQRNILTFLLITGLLLGFLIIYLPHRIFYPFVRMSKILQAISRGESQVVFPDIEMKDEIGELSRSFQKAISRLQLFNELRTSKIAELRRNRNKILDEMMESVIIIDLDMKIKFANESAKNLFQDEIEIDKTSLKDLDVLWKATADLMKNPSQMGRQEIDIKMKTKSLRRKRAVIFPAMGSVDKADQIIIIIK